jgi:hypothetical protein
MRSRFTLPAIAMSLLLLTLMVVKFLNRNSESTIADSASIAETTVPLEESTSQEVFESSQVKSQAISPSAPEVNKPANANTVPITASELVAKLTEIGLHNPITAEEAVLFKQMLAQLILRGDSAVPAVRELFAKKTDADFVNVAGSEELGYPTLRACLIDALKQMGGPEAQALMRDTLQTTTSAAELSALAQNLDQLVPGVYRHDILNAANQVLKLAAENKLGENVELGPALRILNTYGTADMADNPPSHVSAKLGDAAALAKLADAGGLDALIQVAGNSNSDPSERAIASQMIAQLAGQNDKALEILIRMAGNGEISNSTWQKIAPILGGNQYEPGAAASPNSPNYSVANVAATPEQINQRISMIDYFLNVVSSDSAAAAALRLQRGTLVGKLGN